MVLRLRAGRGRGPALLRRGRKLTEVVAGGALSAVADTRLRLVRRLVFATIIVLGLALALAQFPSVKRVATGVLASSAVLGLVVGFAARQTLANAHRRGSCWRSPSRSGSATS